MRNRVEKPILSARVLALVGAAFCGVLAACQSAPPTSKEPAAAATAPLAAPSQGTLQNQGALQGAAPTEATVVKLTGSTAASPTPAAAASAQGAAGSAAHVHEAADKPTPKAGDKTAEGKAPADKAAEGKAAPGKTVQGAVVSEEPFSTWLQVASPAKAGAPLQLEAVLVAKPPYHCNPEYPHKFKLSSAPAGLAYPEETVRGAKVTPERTVLSIPANAQSSGKPTVAGTLSFSVCTEERCLVEKRELSVALDVM
ncbi:MAG: hypothetical protein RL033_185 [Pseudomonadota bacterium]